MSATGSKILTDYLIQSYLFLKDKSITPLPLMFSRQIYEFLGSSHRRCFMKKAVLKNFAISARKLQAINFIKNRLQHRFFPLNIAKYS